MLFLTISLLYFGQLLHIMWRIFTLVINNINTIKNRNKISIRLKTCENLKCCIVHYLKLKEIEKLLTLSEKSEFFYNDLYAYIIFKYVTLTIRCIHLDSILEGICIV